MSDIATQKDALLQCEETIRRGKATFIEVGNALCRIRDDRLYVQSGFGSFNQYCEEVWGWGKSYVSRVIQSADIANKLPIGNSVDTESQARELAKVEPAKREAVLEKAKKSGRVTAKAIKEAAQEDPEPDEHGLIPGPPPPVDEKWLAAMGKAEASEFKPSEPMVTEYYNRLEALVNDALENATEKQLNSMVVYAKIIPGLVRDELNQRKVRK